MMQYSSKSSAGVPSGAGNGSSAMMTPPRVPTPSGAAGGQGGMGRGMETKRGGLGIGRLAAAGRRVAGAGRGGR